MYIYDEGNSAKEGTYFVRAVLENWVFLLYLCLLKISPLLTESKLK
jgi:hypothetical protein